jgi:hypothetical protein
MLILAAGLFVSITGYYWLKSLATAAECARAHLGAALTEARLYSAIAHVSPETSQPDWSRGIDEDVLETSRADYASEEGRHAMIRLYFEEFGIPEIDSDADNSKLMQDIFLHWCRSQQALKNSLKSLSAKV